MKKIAISFTIVKNITAKTGERTLYIRIAKPDNDILTKNASNTFPYENRNLVYSIKKYIEYTGEEQNVTVYWDVEEYLPAGTYHVYIFADGTMIGQQAFSMKITRNILSFNIFNKKTAGWKRTGCFFSTKQKQ